MVTRYEAYIDGIPLSSLAPEIIVKDISEKEAKTTYDTYTMASGSGSRYLRKARESLTVSVKFEIHAYDVVRRQEVMEMVQEWANGRYLALNTRPGKRLSVNVEAMAVVQSALKWTQEITLDFVSRETPFWESEIPEKVVLEGTEGNGFLRPSGTVDLCPMELTVKNAGSGYMDSFSASAGGYTMEFENLRLLPGETFSVVYVDGVQMLPVEKRSPESADDFMLVCNKENEVSFTADQTAEVVFSARGRFY
jgi:hypothetical protein